MHDSLQHEARYQNAQAGQVLDQVLGDVHTDRTADGRPVVVDAGPGTSLTRLYRARVFQSEAPLVEALEHPARLLGTPPPGFSGANRMNAKGVPAFYGASTVGVALAEVRPPVGSKVLSGVFELIRPLKLLDLRHLGQVQLDSSTSLFAPDSLEKAQRRDFLRYLVGQLIQPVMPESQDRDYLVTQVIADYLATHPRGPLDGSIFPSVQAGKMGEDLEFNVVLFARACGVEGAQAAPSARANLWEYEGDSPDRHLCPEIVQVASSRDAGAAGRSAAASSPRFAPALRVVLGELVVYEVRAVHIDTRSAKVSVVNVR